MTWILFSECMELQSNVIALNRQLEVETNKTSVFLPADLDLALPNAEDIWRATQLQHAVYKKYLSEVLSGNKDAQHGGAWDLRVVLPCDTGQTKPRPGGASGPGLFQGLTETVYGVWLLAELKANSFIVKSSEAGHFVSGEIHNDENGKAACSTHSDSKPIRHCGTAMDPSSWYCYGDSCDEIARHVIVLSWASAAARPSPSVNTLYFDKT